MKATRKIVAGVAALVLLAVVLAWSALLWGQAYNVVFNGAYQRTFLVADCSNTNPIVVTIRPPELDSPITYVPLDNGSLVTITGVLGNLNCNVALQQINVIDPLTFELVGIAGNGAYRGGGTGTSDTVSSGIPSPPMENLGQGGHLISVEFPTAVGPVTGVQVRIEVADLCPDPPFCAAGDWRPISDDITTVVDVGGFYFNMDKANGVWRAIRVNSILPTPGDLPMRVDYTGMPFPIGGVVFLGDRFELLTPFSSNQDGGFEFVAGACQDGSAGLAFNGPAPLPTAQCISANETLAVAAFDDTVTECIEDSLLLPNVGTPGTTQLQVYWQAANVGTVRWDWSHVCVRAGMPLGSVAFNPAFEQTVTNFVAGELVTNTEPAVPLLSCLAGDFLFWRMCRAGGVGTLAGDALLKSIRITPAQ